MKRFFDAESTGREAAAYDVLRDAAGEAGQRSGRLSVPTHVPARARVAVYDDLQSAPRIEDVSADDASDFIEALSAKVYEFAREKGGTAPYTIIREVVENLIHAQFAEVVVSILDSGKTIRFSDHGPGIQDKDRSFEPGFSTATQDMKAVIRGVGSGLPIVREYVTFAGGFVAIEDNLGAGTVITLRFEGLDDVPEPQPPENSLPVAGLLTNRHKKVLSLAMEFGAVGPSAVSNELGIGLSTAYRDLAFLEEQGLVDADDAGKRSLTEEGISYLDALFSP